MLKCFMWDGDGGRVVWYSTAAAAPSLHNSPPQNIFYSRRDGGRSRREWEMKDGFLCDNGWSLNCIWLALVCPHRTHDRQRKEGKWTKRRWNGGESPLMGGRWLMVQCSTLTKYRALYFGFTAIHRSKQRNHCSAQVLGVIYYIRILRARDLNGMHVG